ncbi:chloride channel protein [Aestuariispira insulae]|uniref:CIC family chloride channel protein n=1 Tax=Aestuariispira insulae TaxID=1461337 RepID=A0A3D9HGH2_9PROT|nr:chloride channel protein [Aestuariispira insulae]RED48577.1 CIC family chloride channel protein [Aestuariispira insulae]
MPYRDIAAKIKALLLHENLVLLFLAVVIGVIGAYVALAFREVITVLHWLLYSSDIDMAQEFLALFIEGSASHREEAEQLTSRIIRLQWWHVLLAPTLGGLLVGWINHRLLEGGRGQGIANIIERNALHGAEMPVKRGLLGAMASALSIGAGASVGREGPILHLTSTVSTWVALKMRLEPHHRHTLLGCAVAAGVAASFNAPIAGVFFALEVVLRHYALSAFAPVVLSSVIGTMITRVHYGDFPAYVLPHYEITTYWEFPAFILLGIVSGFAAIIFMWSIFFAEDKVKKVKIPLWLKPGIAGLMIGGMALVFPQVLGVGYDTTTLALNEGLNIGVELLLLLVVMKTAATAVSIGGGFGGGVFSPSLFIGAIVGSAFGIIAAGFVPDLNIHTGLYAIVGMAATSAAVLGAPISTILIIFELLGDFKITIGVMSGAAVSSVLVHSLLGKSYYIWQLKRADVELDGARAMQILRQQVVGDVVKREFQSVESTTKLMELIDFLHTQPEDAEVVVVENGHRFIGTIGLEDVKDVAFDPLANQDAIEAQMFSRLYPVVLTVDQSLAQAITLMERWDLDRLPVVEDEDSMTVAGMTDKNTLLSAYVKALLQAEAEAHGGGK